MATSSALKKPSAHRPIPGHAMGMRNNRRTTRRPAHCVKVPCVLQRAVEEGPWAVVVMSVNATAIYLQTRQEFQLGVHLAVAIPDEHGQVKARLLRVTRCEESEAGAEWTVEGIFLKELTPEAVESALARIGVAGCKALCRLVWVQEEGPWLVTMHDVSHRGIGVLCDRPFDRGAYLKLNIHSDRRKQLRAKVIRVMHSAPQPGGEEWVVGGAFLRGLSEEDLQVLQ